MPEWWPVFYDTLLGGAIVFLCLFTLYIAHRLDKVEKRVKSLD